MQQVLIGYASLLEDDVADLPLGDARCAAHAAAAARFR